MAQQTAMMQLAKSLISQYTNILMQQENQISSTIKIILFDIMTKIDKELLPMEKEQQFRFFIAGQLSMEEGGKDFEQYYNETYVENKD